MNVTLCVYYRATISFSSLGSRWSTSGLARVVKPFPRTDSTEGDIG
jgi:hypothetical protein